MIDYRVYLVTDDPSRYVGNWLDNVREAVEGGVTCVQYRDTESVAQIRYERVMALKDALKSFHTPIIINNEVELAVAVNAEGVHVGQGDMPTTAARKIVGANCEIGLSITDITQLDAIDVSSVDALGIGPVFDATKTKRDASAAIGIGGLTDIVKEVHNRFLCLPTVAIGGITMQNAAQILSSEVDGLALVSAFSKAENPKAVANYLINILTNMRNKENVN